MRLLGLLLMVVLAGPASGAATAKGWSSPTKIADTIGESKRPDIAAGADGSLHVVWEDQSPGNWEILYASRGPGAGSWSPSVNISNSPGGSFRPAIAPGQDGSVHVVWHDDSPGNYDIFYAVKPPGGEWSTPLNISNSAGSSYWPSAAVAADGSVHVAWHDDTGGNWEALSASKAADGEWSPATNLSQSAGTSFIPRLLVAGNGLVYVVWQDDTSGKWEIFSASKPPDGPWSAPVNVSNSDGDSAPFAATQSPDGSISVVWREATANGTRLLSATTFPGGTWSLPEDVSGLVGGSGAFVIGVGRDGSLDLLWEESTAGNQDVFFASRPPGGAWSSAVNISASPVESDLGGLAIGAGGSLHVVWRDGELNKGDVLYSEWPAAPAPERAGPPEGMRVVPLTGGCNLVTSSYPDSTAVQALAGAVSPPRALVSLWRRDGSGWLGYSPFYPQVSDLFSQGAHDFIFICTSGEAEFFTPL